MTQVNFKVESQLNGNKGELVVSTHPLNESTILKGDEKDFPLKPGEELCIKVKQNGNIIDLGNWIYIRIWPPKGFNCELSTTKEEIKLKYPLSNRTAQYSSVTVGVGNSG